MNNSIEMWALTNASWHQQSLRTIALYLILSNLSTWARRRTWWWRSRTPSRRPTSRKRSLPDSNFASGVWSAVARDQPGRRFFGISEDRIRKLTRSLKDRTCVPIHMLVLRCFSRVCRGKVEKRTRFSQLQPSSYSAFHVFSWLRCKINCTPVTRVIDVICTQ